MITLALGVIQLAQVGNYNFQRLQRPSVDQIASMIEGCKSSSVVLAADPYTAIELSYYLKCPIHFYSENKSLSGGYSALSNSNLRVANPATELIKYTDIYYIYYGSPKLNMPNGFLQVKSTKTDALNIEQYLRTTN